MPRTQLSSSTVGSAPAPPALPATHSTKSGTGLPLTANSSALRQLSAPPFKQVSAKAPSVLRNYTTRMATAVNPSTTLRGIVIDDPSDRQDEPPHDPAKWMVGLAVLILVLPPLMALLGTAALLACVLALLGMGSIVSCVLLPFGLLTATLGLLRGSSHSQVPVYEFRVQDQNQQSVNVTMIGRRKGGRIARGDEIEAWGEWQDGQHSAMRAWRVQIQSVAAIQGQLQAGGRVTADRPWSKTLGLATLLIALVITVVLYGWPLLSNVLPSLGGP